MAHFLTHFYVNLHLLCQGVWWKVRTETEKQSARWFITVQIDEGGGLDGMEIQDSRREMAGTHTVDI